MSKAVINAKTELYAILGDPIGHSLSPVIMNSSFERYEMDRAFLAFRVNGNELEMALKALKFFGLKGYVFTMPIKESAIPYMDCINTEAEIIGAINCAKLEDGKLVGYNTDSRGFWDAIQCHNLKKRPISKAFVMGMGGFGKAAVAQIALQGVNEIVVVNHFEETQIMKSFSQFSMRLKNHRPDLKLVIKDWKPSEWDSVVSSADLIVNATSNGMYGKGDLDQIFPFEKIETDAIFFDAVYAPLRTKFLERAGEFGHTTVEGLELLIHQGLCSFEIWTGIRVDANIMRRDALNFMNQCQG